MKLPRRRFLQLAASVPALPALRRLASAQTYPSRPVRLLVGYAAGGVNDIVARLTGQMLAERLGQQFIIENRPGAGSNLATEAVVRASPDGYTLLEASTSNALERDDLSESQVRLHPRHRAGREHGEDLQCR